MSSVNTVNYVDKCMYTWTKTSLLVILYVSSFLINDPRLSILNLMLLYKTPLFWILILERRLVEISFWNEKRKLSVNYIFILAFHVWIAVNTLHFVRFGKEGIYYPLGVWNNIEELTHYNFVNLIQNRPADVIKIMSAFDWQKKNEYSRNRLINHWH